MSHDLLRQPIIWVDSNAALEQCCDTWVDCELLALDTEFMRSTTYYPIAGLLQINDGKQNYLIDPLAIDDWYPLIDILDDAERTVALHSCSEDLEVLHMELGCVPARIFDTQIAAAFLNMDFSLGYGALVAQVLQVELPKAETRSDWLQRPLSQPQTFYAALDVEYLFLLAQQLSAQLTELNRLEWLLEEGRRAYKQYKYLQDISNSYTRMKSAWKLSSRQLAVMTRLARWRENFAQQTDVPRNRILKENSMMDIAMRSPASHDDLRRIGGIPERLLRQQGDAIIALVDEALALDESALPEPLPRPLDKAQRAMLNVLREGVKTRAQALALAPELLLRKKDSEALIRAVTDNDWSYIDQHFQGWRKEAIADAIITTLKTL